MFNNKSQELMTFYKELKSKTKIAIDLIDIDWTRNVVLFGEFLSLICLLSLEWAL